LPLRVLPEGAALEANRPLEFLNMAQRANHAGTHLIWMIRQKPFGNNQTNQPTPENEDTHASGPREGIRVLAIPTYPPIA